MAGTVLDDTFTRANSTTSLGSTEANPGTTGTQAWSVTNTAWGIVSNKAYRVATVVAHEQAYVDLTTTDHEVYADLFGAGGENPGLVARWVDTNNHYLFMPTISGVPNLYSKVAGTYTSLGTTATGIVTGERWGIRCVGTTITVYRNGSVALTVTNSALTSGTKVGLNGYDGTTTQTFDNFHANTYPVPVLAVFATPHRSNIAVMRGAIR